ncbi:hypothetical protein BH24CHL9_BH24CHL9_02280 [soil metagenome]
MLSGVPRELAREAATLPVMEAAHIVSLPVPTGVPIAPRTSTAAPAAARGERESAVRVLRDRILIADLTVSDAALAAFVADRPADAREALVERALRIGLTALQDAGASMDVDVVRREFEAMLRQAEAVNEKVASQVDAVLRQNFADGEGRLPRTLEAFLGDRGQLRGFVRELFDEDRRDSAIGRLRGLLGTYFDGDASRLAQLLDPTRLGSPLHQFRTEVTSGFERLNERLAAIEAASAARASERSRSSAKGADFEELIGGLLAESLRGTDHHLERSADEAGDVIRSRKGDFVVTLDPDTTRGATRRVVVECKDRRMSGRAMRDEIAEARRNRDACVGLVVFSAAHAPAGIAPFDIRMGDVYCVVDPTAPEPATLDAALRLARLLAQATLRDERAEVDPVVVREALERVGAQLDALRGLKVQLTTIGTAARAVSDGLDRMRDEVVAHISAAEAELRRPDGQRQAAVAA